MAVVYYKKLNENAVEPFKKYGSDFCYDLVATSVKELSPNVYEYGVGLAINIDRDKLVSNKLINKLINKLGVIIDLDVRPRSSISDTGLILANCEGTIDELYRGEMKCRFYQVILGKEIYKVGDKIAQCKLGFTLPIDWIEVEDLNNTERGEGGFGSTGR